LWLVGLGFTEILRISKTTGSRCAVICNEDKADVDQSLAWNSIECSVFHDDVKQKVIHYVEMIYYAIDHLDQVLSTLETIHRTP
jgi:trans-2-enoyl-CoA reductase